MDFHALLALSEMPFCTERLTKRCITAGPEFDEKLGGKNLIVVKSLYGLKTSAARFHEHLVESLLRLGFMKTKYDPDLWMVDKSSHYEYLGTYADNILFSSKELMAVIKSLEKVYFLKNVGIPEYHLGGNVEFLGESRNTQGLRLAFSAKTYIQKVIPKFEHLYEKQFKSLKTLMSEGLDSSNLTRSIFLRAEV